MVTPTKGARLGSSPAHERLILANLATSLYEHGKIKTTFVRAKRVQPLAERQITIAKKGTLAARRQIMTTIRDKSVVHLLMTELAEQFAGRNGGYTRIIKTEPRKGDQAAMAIIELVQEPLKSTTSAQPNTGNEQPAVSTQSASNTFSTAGGVGGPALPPDMNIAAGGLGDAIPQATPSTSSSIDTTDDTKFSVPSTEEAQENEDN